MEELCEELDGFWAQWISDEIKPFPTVGCNDECDSLASLESNQLQPDLEAEAELSAETFEEQSASCDLEKVPPATPDQAPAVPAPSPEEAAAAEQAKLQRQADRRAATLAKEQKRAERAEKKAAAAPPLIKTKTPGRPELTSEQLANAEALRDNGVAVPKDEWLVRTKSAAAIARALAELQLQKDVSNPGGWLFQGLNSGRFDEEAPATMLAAGESEADRVRRAEDEQRRKSAPRHQSGTAISAAQREANLQAIRDREAAHERADRQRRDAETVKEMAALDVLHPDEYEALYVRAKASLGKLTLPESAMKGAMLGLLQADKRRTLVTSSTTT